jgi:hypothetical protein
MAAVQLGLWSLIEKYGIPLINKAIIELMQVFGMTEQEAKDVMANKIIVALEEVGIFAATLKTKLPIKVAELLGFTSKGFAIRKVSQAVEVKLAKAGISATTAAVTTTAEVAKVVEVVAKGRGLNVGLVGSLFSGFINTIGKISIPLILAANVMDFGNWQGAYQKTFQKIFTGLGFPPDSPMPKANTLSPDVWKRIYSTIETLDPIGISFAFSDVDKPYSRANLADMIDEIAANLVKNKEQATYKTVIGIALPLIQLRGQPDITKMDKLNFVATALASGGSSGGATSVPTTKVFTGVISQGVVGQGLVFTGRQDDLIESVAELRSAAANNLAPFLAALPAKVVYEVKVVASITTKDGFKQTGTTQKILSGYDSKGVARYKTVTNKFAVLDLFVLSDRGTRTKISTVVLGPVDSAKFIVAQNDLRALETQLPSLVTTSNIHDITGIETVNPITVTTPPQTTTPVATIQVDESVDTGFRFYSFSVNGEEYLEIQPWLGNIPFGYTPLTQAQFLELEFKKLKDNSTRWKAYFDDIHKRYPNALAGGKSGYYIKDGVPYQTANVFVPVTSSPVGTAKIQAVKPVANATTLFDWYQAQGRSVPSIADRSVAYEGFGLGSRSYYTGTAEQNTKLLNALKGGTNVQPLSDTNYRGYIDNGALGVS